MTEGTAACTSATALLIQQSSDKLEAAAEALKLWISNENSTIHALSCVTKQPQQHQTAYRCRCSFQLLFLQQENAWRYAIRRDKQPIVIDSFPIANHRIQRAMNLLLIDLNSRGNGSNTNNDMLTQHLTSVSFSSPWQDDDEDDDDDDDIDSHNSNNDAAAVVVVVVVTLHYDGPIADATSWTEQARRMCQTCGFSQLSGRSKKAIVRAFPEDEDDGASSSNIITLSRRRPSSIYDTLSLEKGSTEKASTTAATTSCWNVTFLKYPDDMTTPYCSRDDDDNDHGGMKITRRILPVHYCKPEGAFFHPNASVMMLALKWLLNRVQYIIDTAAITRIRRPRLLELYCGCGAHTMPLALSRLLSHITALELDERLVRALKHNCRLNNLAVVVSDGNNDNDSPSRLQQHSDGLCTTTVVECISSDAGTWAREQQQKRQRRQDTDENVDDLEYDILLVDPPRSGLDEQVCQLALLRETSSSSSSLSVTVAFSHILYISCGKQALIRDLERMSAGYELVDCALLDLFPQTEAVETLVHLQRRRT